MRQILALVVTLVFVSPVWAQTKKPAQATQPALSDTQIKEAIVKQSILSYLGSCACPFNTDKAGRSCGRRSAYSKPGRAAPLCYVADVTAKMVENYRAARGERPPAVMPVARPPAKR